MEPSHEISSIRTPPWTCRLNNQCKLNTVRKSIDIILSDIVINPFTDFILCDVIAIRSAATKLSPITFLWTSSRQTCRTLPTVNAVSPYCCKSHDEEHWRLTDRFFLNRSWSSNCVEDMRRYVQKRFSCRRNICVSQNKCCCSPKTIDCKFIEGCENQWPTKFLIVMTSEPVSFLLFFRMLRKIGGEVIVSSNGKCPMEITSTIQSDLLILVLSLWI